MTENSECVCEREREREKEDLCLPLSVPFLLCTVCVFVFPPFLSSFLPVFSFSFSFLPFIYLKIFSLNLVLKKRGKKICYKKGFFHICCNWEKLSWLFNVNKTPHIYLSIHSKLLYIYDILISNQDHNKHHKPLAQLFLLPITISVLLIGFFFFLQA